MNLLNINYYLKTLGIFYIVSVDTYIDIFVDYFKDINYNKIQVEISYAKPQKTHLLST